MGTKARLDAGIHTLPDAGLLSFVRDARWCERVLPAAVAVGVLVRLDNAADSLLRARRGTCPDL